MYIILIISDISSYPLQLEWAWRCDALREDESNMTKISHVYRNADLLYRVPL